jgi:hypothetical protein
VFTLSVVFCYQFDGVSKDVKFIHAVAFEVIPRTVPALRACMVGWAKGNNQPIALALRHSNTLPWVM